MQKIDWNSCRQLILSNGTIMTLSIINDKVLFKIFNFSSCVCQTMSSFSTALVFLSNAVLWFRILQQFQIECLAHIFVKICAKIYSDHRGHDRLQWPYARELTLRRNKVGLALNHVWKEFGITKIIIILMKL